MSELEAELKDLDKFLQARRGDDSDVIAGSMATAFCHKIACTRQFTASTALAMCNALNATQLPEIACGKIQAAIDARLNNSGSKPQDRHTPQKLTAINNYLTNSDWQTLQSPTTSLSGKIAVLVHRFQRLNLRYPHEQTVKWAVALLALHAVPGSYPTYASVHGMVQDFKAQIEMTRRGPALHSSHIVVYPDDPHSLPKDFFDVSYSDGEPVAMDIERLAVTAENHVPLRSTSKLLGKEKAPIPSVSNTSSSSAGSGVVTWEALASMMQGRMPAPQLSMMPPPRQPSMLSLMNGAGGSEHSSADSGHSLAHSTLADSPPPLHDAAPLEGAPPLRMNSTSHVLALGHSPLAFDFAKRQQRLNVGASPAGAGRDSPATKKAVELELELASTKAAAFDSDDKGGKNEDAAERVSTEQYEDAAFKALAARGVKRALLKKPAACPDDNVLKRPAASTGSAGGKKSEWHVVEYTRSTGGTYYMWKGPGGTFRSLKQAREAGYEG